MKQGVIEDILSKLESWFGKEAPLTVTCRKVHVYLGMHIDYSMPGQVAFTMFDFIDEILAEAPADLMKGVSATIAANHLFTTDSKAQKIPKDEAELFHHLVAKLQLAVSFLTTRVQSPDVDDQKKLGLLRSVIQTGLCLVCQQN